MHLRHFPTWLCPQTYSSSYKTEILAFSKNLQKGVLHNGCDNRPIQWRIQDSGKGGAMPKGGGTWVGAHIAEGRHVKKKTFAYALPATAACRESLLHNEVAQVGIEEEMNAEPVWPLLCRF